MVCQLEKLIAKPWAPDGKNFSDRIWQSKQQMVSALHTELTRTCLLGKAPDEAIRHMTQFVDGKCNNAKAQAGRLVMTEQAFFASAAQEEAFNDLDVEEFEIVATIDSMTSPVCRQMDGKHFSMKDFKAGVTAPPFHPWCRSCTCPYFDDEFTTDDMRAARDEETGETYYIPADMTYPEWKEKFVDGGEKKGLQEVERGLAVKNGEIHGITTTRSEKIPAEVQKDIDQTLHKLCSSMGIDSRKINEIVFEDLGSDIARASITDDMYIKLKFNERLFSSEAELKQFLGTQVKSLTTKNGLEGYITHELVHIKEYLHAIKQNTVGGVLNSAMAFDDISRSVYSAEILKDALKACNLDYNDVIIENKISFYGTYNASEAIAEAVSNHTHNELCDKIKLLIEKKWG